MYHILIIPFLAALLSGCGYNTLQSTDENIKASWSEVLNQYQRRADLVPNLVNVVKGYAAHVDQILAQVDAHRVRAQFRQAFGQNAAAAADVQNALAGQFGVFLNEADAERIDVVQGFELPGRIPPAFRH